MADAASFDFVCDQLEARTSLDRLAARGTVRIVLKRAGLDSRSATSEQMAVAVEKLLAEALASRGVADAALLCSDIATKTRRLSDAGGAETPESILRRLSG